VENDKRGVGAELLHQMKLRLSPFEKIKNGSKTIEMWLFDEKRQKVQTGDYIEFTCFDDATQKIQTRVTALHRFNSFAELYAALPKEKLGYNLTDTPDPNHMDDYYTREDQEKYCPCPLPGKIDTKKHTKVE